MCLFLIPFFFPLGEHNIFQRGLIKAFEFDISGSKIWRFNISLLFLSHFDSS